MKSNVYLLVFTDWAELVVAFGIGESTVRWSCRCAIALESAHNSAVPHLVHWGTGHWSTICDHAAAAVCASAVVCHNCSALMASLTSVSMWLVWVHCRSHANCHPTLWFGHDAVPCHTSILGDTIDSRTFSVRLSFHVVARDRICTNHRRGLDYCALRTPAGMQYSNCLAVAAAVAVASVAPILSNCECHRYFPIAAERTIDFADFDFASASDWCASDTDSELAPVVLDAE